MKLKKNVQKTMNVWQREYKKGLTAYIILLLLKNDCLYGYQLTSMMTELMDNHIVFKENAIYSILKQLNKKEFVSYEWKKSTKGPKRKYYRIADSGDQLIAAFTADYVMPMLSGLGALVETKIGNEKNEEGGEKNGNT